MIMQVNLESRNAVSGTTPIKFGWSMDSATRLMVISLENSVSKQSVKQASLLDAMSKLRVM